jgi:hypothetical protein
MGGHRISLHPISDDINFPIYFDGTLNTDYKDVMYVLNSGNCVTIIELKSISENEREKSSLLW